MNVLYRCQGVFEMCMEDAYLCVCVWGGFQSAAYVFCVRICE